MKCDLHMHSYYSDGDASPEELVKMAKDKGLKCIALTDHDTLRGVKEIIDSKDVEVIPAIEIGCAEGIEFLGYFVDLENSKLKDLVKRAKDRRNSRTETLVKLLKEKKGFDVSKELKKVMKNYKSDYIGNKHISDAMVLKGVATDQRDAFDNKGLNDVKNLVKSEYPSYEEVISVILEAGGVPVMAHPQWTFNITKEKLRDLVKEFMGYGLMGIETCGYCKDELLEIQKESAKLAKEFGLLETAGSDYHSEKLKTNPFGSYICDYSVVENMKSLRKVLIAQGAEAKIYFKDGTVIKERVVKEYRHAEIDRVIRKSSTRSEVKLLEKAKELVPVPRVLEHCDREMFIKMEFVEGEKLRDLVEKYSVKERKEIFFRVGKKIAKLHNNDIIHGDLTTSNLIVKDKIHFIDFGLGFISIKVEDKAVDLHLIVRALDSKHYTCAEDCFESILEGYASESKEFEKIMERFKKVALRGRYKGSKK